ncbi:MAG: SDR family oxidoreductase [Pseudomonadota bacterium]
MGRVDGKTALVTGGGSGLGAETARLLVKEGARVAVTDINPESAAEVAAEINAERDGAAISLGHDVTSPEQWTAALDAAKAAFGGLNILVNNAGIGGTAKNIEEEDLKDWLHVQDVNSTSIFLGCKLALPYMQDAGPGSIVNISSIAAHVADANMPSYNASKAAVRHLTKSVALHCTRHNYDIRCNSVHPAFVTTAILAPFEQILGGKENAHGALARHIPMRRLGRPEEVAYAVLYLASDESSFSTGSELIIDGGLSAK